MDDLEYCKEIQNQEIEVISNIFIDNFTTFYDYDGVIGKYNLRVQVDVPENFTITSYNLKENSDSDNSDNSGTSDDSDGDVKQHKHDHHQQQQQQQSYAIKYLPYIDLSWEYPAEYPEQPPRVYISSIWLTLEQMFGIVKKLESDWTSGEMVIYKYYDWIKTELLSYLQIDKTQVFTNQQVDLESPLCSIVTWTHKNEWDSLISTLPFLISYSKNQEKSQFALAESYECPICCCDYAPDEMVLLECLHYSCKDCTTQICKVNIESGSIKLLKCSNLECNQLLDQDFIKSIVTPAEYKQYEVFLQQDRNLVQCKRCPTGWGYLDNLTKSSYCTQCKYCWCTLCHSDIHYGLPCYYVAPPKVRVQRQKKDKDKKHNDPEWLNRPPAPPPVSIVKSICKKCPGCGALLDKFEGCNKIVCPYCKRMLCWLCLSTITSYEHFQKSCVLFETPLAEPAVPLPPPPPVIDKEKARTKDISNCGKCKNLIFRNNNNNHSYCDPCKQSVCFLCKEFIKGTTHFTTSNCIQHGDPPNRVVDEAFISNQINRFNNPKPQKTLRKGIPTMKNVIFYDNLHD
ncbi:hypothetical protein CYY_009945 [Polysphondylium violaceum]|uniref:RING-type domain-containing protein n=1 Tax=Polysphondylium violaceum TaxID=133409 RepID=A0A8J4UP55_9MYCE|nr:hypothetical protein CYY_009945 [Polysphondylium violaceum]